MAGRVGEVVTTKEQIDAVVEGANRVVEQLRAENIRFEEANGIPPTPETAYDGLRVALLKRFFKRAS